MKNIFVFICVCSNAQMVLGAEDSLWRSDAKELSCSVQYVKTMNYKGYILDSLYLATYYSLVDSSMNGSFTFPNLKEIASAERYLDSRIRDFLTNRLVNTDKAFPNTRYFRIYQCFSDENGDRILEIDFFPKAMMTELLKYYRKCEIPSIVGGDQLYIKFNITKECIDTFMDYPFDIKISVEDGGCGR